MPAALLKPFGLLTVTSFKKEPIPALVIKMLRLLLPAVSVTVSSPLTVVLPVACTKPVEVHPLTVTAIGSAVYMQVEPPSCIGEVYVDAARFAGQTASAS